MTDFLRADARMALARYESSVAAFGMEAGFPMKDVRVVKEYIDQLEVALRNVTTTWDLWQKTSDSNSFTELFVKICEAKALEEKND